MKSSNAPAFQSGRAVQEESQKYIEPLIAQLHTNANPPKAESMAAYMRGQFPFLGIQTPQRKELFKKFWSEQGAPPLSLIEDISWYLWQQPEREFHYVAMTLLGKVQKKLGPEIIGHYEKLAITKSWWDTTDGLASSFIGATMLRYPEAKDPWINQWRTSDNFWLRRITLLFQLSYKTRTDAELLFELIREHSGSLEHQSEFFIQKAIGWALREYSKTDAKAVTNFIANTELAPLSQREGLKWVKAHPNGRPA